MKQITLLLISLLLTSSAAMAQRNVEVVVPYVTGGTADRMAQSLLPHLREHMRPFGINPVLQYRPGAGSMLGSGAVARTAAHDLKLLLVGNSLVTAPLTTQKPDAYDLDRDFKVLYYLGHVPMLLVVNSASKMASIKDFQTACQQRTLSYGSSGVGSATHLSAQLVSNMLGCKTLHVPYKGLGAAITDLHGRHIDFVVDFVTSIKPHLSPTGFTPLLTVANQRNREFAELPNIREITGQSYVFYNWFVLAANGSLAAGDHQILQQVMLNLSRDPAWNRTLDELGLDDPSLKFSATFLQDEAANFAPMIQSALGNAK